MNETPPRCPDASADAGSYFESALFGVAGPYGHW